MSLPPHDKLSLLSALETIRKFIESQDDRRSCTTCVFLKQGICEKWEAKPPADYVKVGCSEWVFDVESPPF
jgi:hypothetical protein